MTIRTSRCYVEYINMLQGHMDAMVEAYPDTRGVVPRFTHHDNPIGAHLVTGEPLQDPFITIEWDTET